MKYTLDNYEKVLVIHGRPSLAEVMDLMNTLKSLENIDFKEYQLRQEGWDACKEGEATDPAPPYTPFDYTPDKTPPYINPNPGTSHPVWWWDPNYPYKITCCANFKPCGNR